MAERPVRYRLSADMLAQTFQRLRQCGQNRRECQVLWISAWAHPETLTEVVHPQHRAHAGGFEVDSPWLNSFWMDLARSRCGVRAQVHTHPGEAFHSATDDAHPIIASVGLLSLVIPRFAQGPIGFEAAYLTQLQADGEWQEVPIAHHLEVTP